jgi:hypothetical protein
VEAQSLHVDFLCWLRAARWANINTEENHNFWALAKWKVWAKPRKSGDSPQAASSATKVWDFKEQCRVWIAWGSNVCIIHPCEHIYSPLERRPYIPIPAARESELIVLGVINRDELNLRARERVAKLQNLCIWSGRFDCDFPPGLRHTRARAWVCVIYLC